MSDRPDYDRTDRPSTAQPPPVPVPDAVSLHDLAIADCEARGWYLAATMLGERKAFGLRKYGTLLQAGNGRDPISDAAEEAADLAVYLRQAVAERGREFTGMYLDALFILSSLVYHVEHPEVRA